MTFEDPSEEPPKVWRSVCHNFSQRMQNHHTNVMCTLLFLCSQTFIIIVIIPAHQQVHAGKCRGRHVLAVQSERRERRRVLGECFLALLLLSSRDRCATGSSSHSLKIWVEQQPESRIKLV